MAQAIVKYLDTRGSGGANLQKLVCAVTYYGDDVSLEIAEQKQVEVEVTVENSFTRFKLESAVLSAVKDKAVELGISVLSHEVRMFPFSRIGAGADEGLAYVASLSPAAWYRYGLGITTSGTAVTQWDDQSGNGRHFKQPTGTNQPVLLTYGSVLLDGSNKWMFTDTFTFDQPLTVFILCQMLTWISGGTLFGGRVALSGTINQRGVSPQIGQNSGTGAITNGELALNTWGVVAGVINGASSSVQIGRGVPQTGNPGAGNPGGFTLASDAGFAFGNMKVKEVIVFPGAMAAGPITAVIEYLNGVGDIGL